MIQDPGSRGGGMSTGAIIGMMAIFVVVGGPMVFYLWSTVNDVLTGRFAPMRVLIALPVLLIFLGVLAILSRSVRRWEERLHH